MKSQRTYYVFLTLLLIGYMVFEMVRPKPLNWDETYINKDKIPFGTYVIYDYLNDVFPHQEIKTIHKPIYNEVGDLYAKNENIKNKFNYIFINDIFKSDTMDLRLLYDFAEAGNSVFIAADYNYADTLEKKLGFRFEAEGNYLMDSVVTNFTAKQFQSTDGYFYRGYNSGNHFTIINKSAIDILGTNNHLEPDFIRIKYGDGYFYFNAHPRAFTNYYVMSDSTNEYAFKALSYLPVRKVLWDEYQKTGLEGDQSMFRVLMNNAPLKWAYYLTVISLLVFILFESKRVQRIIPVIEPLKNTTLEFTRTLGNMYLRSSNHKSIALKKITFLMEFIRQRFNVSTNEITDELMSVISNKSGMNKSKVEDIFKMINYISNQPKITQDELLKFNYMLENFYQVVAS